MSDDGISNLKTRMLFLLSELDDAELNKVEYWISSQSYIKDLDKMKMFNKSEKELNKIRHSIKLLMPLEAVMSTENIVMPTVGDQANCSKINTLHVDAFLYDDDEVEKLVKKGKLQRHYCLDCHSRNIKDLIFISHSMSKLSLQYIFKVLLPSDLNEKRILDIGSRIGAVIFTAYHLTNASKIIGVEMNEECCNIQKTIKEEYSMDPNRIQIIHSDIMEQKDLVQNSDILIFNVFDFYVDVEKHKQMWYFFKEHIKKGTYIVTNRSMPETLGSLEICEDFMDWLNICKPCQLENDIVFDIEDFDYNEMNMYIVN